MYVIDIFTILYSYVLLTKNFVHFLVHFNECTFLYILKNSVHFLYILAKIPL